MKRFALIIFTFFSVVACRHEIDPDFALGNREFKATIEDGTKTALSGLDIIWDSSDIVYLFQGTYNSGNKTTYRIKEDCAGSTSTTLISSGSAYVGSENNLNVAIYGLVANNLFGDGSHLTAYVVLPDNQTYVQNSFGKNTMPMIAVTPLESNTLSFKNICGVLELKFKGENINVHSIRVSGNNNEQIAGVATVNMSSTYGYIPEAVFGNSIGEIKKTVSLNFTTPAALNSETPTCFYITLPPVTFTKGITVEIETDNGTITKSTAKSLSIDRNSIRPMAAATLIDAEPPYIDLGLSVKWATKNLGANKSYDYGNYYAWGETSTKSVYNESTYLYYTNGSTSNITKYNTLPARGIVDNKTRLEQQDDAVYALYGSNWRMPTSEEWSELINNCQWEIETVNGIKGIRGTSLKVGHTSNSIFLPLAGDYDSHGTDLQFVGEYASYLTSDLKIDKPWDAVTVYFYNTSSSPNIDYLERHIGQSIRPVYSNK